MLNKKKVHFTCRSHLPQDPKVANVNIAVDAFGLCSA